LVTVDDDYCDRDVAARTGVMKRHSCFSEEETLQIGLILFSENLGDFEGNISKKTGLASVIP
jgi:hypothetical protein